MEKDLNEALYALNRALSNAPSPAAADALTHARDSVFNIGVWNFGWKD